MPLPPRHSQKTPSAQPDDLAAELPLSDQDLGAIAANSTSGADQSAGTQVNAFSRAVLPSDQFPFHFDCLMNDLFQRGITPESWQVIAGDEVRLDEDGMDIEFTLVQIGSNHVWRRRINVQRGRLVSIVER